MAKQLIDRAVWVDQTREANGNEVFLPRGVYEAPLEPITHQLNLTGDGQRRTTIRGATFRYHGVEKYHPPFEHFDSPLVLRRLDLINCVVDLRFVSHVLLEDCYLWNTIIRGFSWWDSWVNRCKLLKSKLILEDATGPEKSNRGFSNTLLVDQCLFEQVEDYGIYLGYLSRCCRVTNSKFESRLPGRHAGIKANMRHAKNDGDHWFSGLTCSADPKNDSQLDLFNWE